jgi:predicted nucleic acid-binding protein
VETIICDTDVVIDYFNRTNHRHQNTKKLIEAEIGLSFIMLSAITKMELIMGIQNKVDLLILNK